MAGTASGPDPTLYLYTSLTAGSSHIITATSRLETILKANKIAFRAIDCATDEKARSLWSRRSKGRKIPGLVKYGQVIGDLEAVEEWNEYGEIKENIDNVSDLFGDTPMTDTPMPPPAPITLKDPLAKVSEPPSRSSSETRHISISEPTSKGKDGSGSAGSSVRNSRDDTPMSLAMRQLGAEAAAKATQKKANITSPLKSSAAASVIPAKRDSTETTPSPSAIKKSIEAEEPAQDTGITAAKTPAKLADEGAKKTSTDKIADHSSDDATASSDSESDTKSNDEQKLDARRVSAVAKVPSRLQQEMSIDDVKTPPLEESSSKKVIPEQAISMETSFADAAPRAGDVRPQHHRGSSLSEASKEEIRAIEAKNAILEQPEEENSSSDVDQRTALSKSNTKSTIQATDKGEADVMKGSNPQDQKAKDANAAGVSAATSLFLSPNHNSNPNRLSADSASVYSFFDSAFSPAPLFSDSKNLDLDLSFMQSSGKVDHRLSISTYGTNDTGINDSDQAQNQPRHDDTLRQSRETQRSASQSQQHTPEPQDSPRQEILPSVPTIAPLRTQARRQVSEPLLSNRVSTPSSVPLPLSIRKGPINPLAQHQIPSRTLSTSQQPTPQTTRSNPQLRTNLADNQPVTTSLSPTSTTATASPSPSTPTDLQSQSRSLRFKKSIRSLRSKKSSHQLHPSDSPSNTDTPAMPQLPIPPQKQLRDLGAKRSVSDNYASVKRAAEGGKSTNGSGRERGKLLCF